MPELLPKPLRLLIVFSVLTWISGALFFASLYIGASQAAAIFAFALGASIVGVFGLGGASP